MCDDEHHQSATNNYKEKSPESDSKNTKNYNKLQYIYIALILKYNLLKSQVYGKFPLVGYFIDKMSYRLFIEWTVWR